MKDQKANIDDVCRIDGCDCCGGEIENFCVLHLRFFFHFPPLPSFYARNIFFIQISIHRNELEGKEKEKIESDYSFLPNMLF